MEITEVRVKLVDGKQDKLKAFCSITIEDCFVIRDLKIIEGSKGLFVAMPSRRLTVRCPKCGAKNQIRSNFCAECGYALPQDRGNRTRNGRLKLHADIAHPINSKCREEIQSRVLESYQSELDASTQPGYQPPSFDDLDASVDGGAGAGPSPAPAVEPPPAARTETSADDGAERRAPGERRERRGRGDRGSRGGRDRGGRDHGGRDHGGRARREERPSRVDRTPPRPSPAETGPEEVIDDNFGAGLF